MRFTILSLLLLLVTLCAAAGPSNGGRNEETDESNKECIPKPNKPCPPKKCIPKPNKPCPPDENEETTKCVPKPGKPCPPPKEGEETTKCVPKPGKPCPSKTGEDTTKCVPKPGKPCPPKEGPNEEPEKPGKGGKGGKGKGGEGTFGKIQKPSAAMIGKPRKAQPTGVPKDVVVPCTAPFGTENGCSYCDKTKGVKPTPMWKTPINPFNYKKAVDYADDQGQKGYTVWFSIPQPRTTDDGKKCKTLIVVGINGKKPAFGTSGYTTVVAAEAGCYGATIQNTGYGVSECCGNDECAMYGAGIDFEFDKRSIDAGPEGNSLNRRAIDAGTLDERDLDGNPIIGDDTPIKRERRVPRKVSRRNAADEALKRAADSKLVEKRSTGFGESLPTVKHSFWKRFTTFDSKNTKSDDKAVPEIVPEDPKDKKCEAAVPIEGGDVYERLGLQQVNNSMFGCNGVAMSPCRVDLSTTATYSESNAIGNGTTDTSTTGGSVAIQVGWQSGVFPGAMGSVTGTVSQDESKAIEESFTNTKEKGGSDTVSLDLVMAANTIAKVTWVPILGCKGYKTQCPDGERRIEHCKAPPLDKGPSGMMTLMYLG